MIVPPRPEAAAEIRQSECAEMLDRVLEDLVQLSVASGWNEVELYDAMEEILKRRRFSADARNVVRLRSH